MGFWKDTILHDNIKKGFEGRGQKSRRVYRHDSYLAIWYAQFKRAAWCIGNGCAPEYSAKKQFQEKWENIFEEGASGVLFNVILGYVKILVWKKDISLSLTPVLLYHLLASSLDNKKLIVFDDVERHQFSDEKDFFGLINNLVENQNCKVLFVTNNFQMLNGEIREKLIWKCLTYAPDPKELATTLLCGEKGVGCEYVSVDHVKCIRAAAERANCHNARAIIKAKPLIQMALSRSASIETDFDNSRIEEALTDLIEYSLLEASSDSPKAPDYTTEEFSCVFDTEYLAKVRRYREYASLHVIHDFFTPKHSVSTIDVHEALSNFLSWKYPDTIDSKRVKLLFEEYDRIDFMSTLEAFLYARLLFSSYFNIDVETSYLLEYVRKLFSLLECGFFFDCKSYDAHKHIRAFFEKVYRRSCELVCPTIVTSLKMLQEEPDNHFPNDDTVYSKRHFEELKKYLENENKIIFQRKVESITNGSELHVFINEEIDNKRDPLRWLSPSKIADLFCTGDEKSQIEIINGVSKIRSLGSPGFSEWADELYRLISGFDFNNPLFRHRCFTLRSILRS